MNIFLLKGQLIKKYLFFPWVNGRVALHNFITCHLNYQLVIPMKQQICQADTYLLITFHQCAVAVVNITWEFRFKNHLCLVHCLVQLVDAGYHADVSLYLVQCLVKLVDAGYHADASFYLVNCLVQQLNAGQHADASILPPLRLLSGHRLR